MLALIQVFQVMSMNNEPTINLHIDNDHSSNYQSGSGYQSLCYGVEQSSSGDSSNPWQADQFRDGYQENIFEINLGVSQTIDKNGQPCLLDPQHPTTFSDVRACVSEGEGCPFLSRFSPRDTPYTESAGNPNPQLPGYGSGSGYKSKKSQQSAEEELEL